MTPHEQAMRKELDALRRENRLLQRKVHRSELNRARLEEYKERNDAFLRSIITEMRSTQAALEISERDAQQANKTKSQFLANISHEIRTPMNAVLGMTELLLKSNLTREQRRLVHAAQEAGNGLLELINDILDLSKAEAGHLELEKTQVDLHNLVESVVSMFGKQAEAKGLHLGCCIDPTVPVAILGDPGRLRQILLNLVNNAVKFTHTGSVIIAVRHALQEDHQSRIFFEIRDTGIGIDTDVQRCLFKPFVQADGSMTRRYGGTGLGLAISQDLAQLMGGNIYLCSAKDEGSTFVMTVKFPLGPTVPPKAVRVEHRSRRRLLIFHPQPDIAQGICNQALKLGIQAVAISPKTPKLPPSERWIDTMVIDPLIGETTLKLLVGDWKRTRRKKPSMMLLVHPSSTVPDAILNISGAAAMVNRSLRTQDLRESLERLWNTTPPIRKTTESQVIKMPKRISSGGRILLIEDNPVNQMMAQGMLRRLGCHVDVASNGQLGFNKWSKGYYDLVLMDCQMPVCDGFQSTALIRNHEAKHGLKPIPIVALTAHAMEGDRERCIQGGMNDYLTKPFTLKELRGLLQNWLSKGNAPKTPTKESLSIEDPDAELFDLQVWKTFKKSNHPSDLNHILTQWLDTAGDLIKTLGIVVAADDREEIQALSEALKSSCDRIGAIRVSELCINLEQLGRLNVPHAMPPLVDALKKAWASAQNEIERIIKPMRNTEDRLAPKSHIPVLVVDDDPTIRRFVRSALAPLGCHVIEASSGAEALECFAQERPHLVLLDVIMGTGIDGFEVCARIRKESDSFEVPVMLMTGLDDVKSIQTAYTVGATDFVTKPFNLHVIRNRVRYMLRMRQSALGLRKREAQLASAHRIAGVGSWLIQNEDDKAQISSKALRILGVGGEVTPDKDNALEWLHQYVATEDRTRVLTSLEELAVQGGRSHLQFRICLPDGKERVVQEHAERHCDHAGRTLGLMGTVMDITDQVRAQERIHNLAYYDSVTSLPNREFFMEKLQKHLDMIRASKTPGHLGVFFIDLDRFKRINDTLGHSIGDRLLRCVGDRFQSTLIQAPNSAQVGTPTLARFGGDEFVLLIPDLNSRSELDIIATALLEALEMPFRIEGHELHASASIGVALYPEDGEDAESLLKNTDQAMYQVKDQGGNGFRYFTPNTSRFGKERLLLETEMRRALLNDEFELFYQPKIDVQNWKLVGAEALLRWRHPERGLVSPNHFIPLAEETGLIVPLGEWVLERACQDARIWIERGIDIGRIAVNLSPKQFGQRDLVERILAILSNQGLSPTRLELEITESAVMTNVDEAISVLRRLREAGITISVDDFGTGHSSLNYLRRLPVDTLKIDRSFITGVGETGSEDQVIAATIIALGQTLRLNIIAEGVETLAQLSFLSGSGCHEIQGYLFSRPLDVDTFVNFIETHIDVQTQKLTDELVAYTRRTAEHPLKHVDPALALM